MQRFGVAPLQMIQIGQGTSMNVVPRLVMEYFIAEAE